MEKLNGKDEASKVVLYFTFIDNLEDNRMETVSEIETDEGKEEGTFSARVERTSGQISGYKDRR